MLEDYRLTLLVEINLISLCFDIFYIDRRSQCSADRCPDHIVAATLLRPLMLQISERHSSIALKLDGRQETIRRLQSERSGR